METIHREPDIALYRAYTDYLSQTPESFSPSSGVPILFRRFRNAKLRILESDLIYAPLLAPFVLPTANGRESAAVRESHQNEGENAGAADGAEGLEDAENAEDEEDEDTELEVSQVQIYAASDYLHLYFPSCSQPGGVRIPHPLITLHAIQSSSPPSIYLQLQSSNPPHGDYDPESTVELTLIPAPSPNPAGAPPSPPEEPSFSPTQALYDALRIGTEMWSNLGGEDNGEGPSIMLGVEGSDEAAGDNAVYGLPPPIPGSGGWITADNVGEFFDEEGNWREREAEARPDGVNELGEGAGIVRPREDDHHEGETGSVNGEEAKRRRTD